MTTFKKQLTWPTVQRLTEYLIILEQFIRSGKATISSSELATIYSNTASQVRQDIFRLPNTGRVGHGYNVHELSLAIRGVLEMNQKTNLVMIGCGRIGVALTGHIAFKDYGMELVGAFDNDTKLIGTDLLDCDDKGVKVQDITLIKDFIQSNNVQVACLCTPQEVAQDVVDSILETGVTGILNYSKRRLKVPKHVYVQHKQLVCSFMQVAYASKQPRT